MNLSDDDFALLGLPQQYALDVLDLQKRWKNALGATHPDRFSQAGAAGQRIAVQWTVRLNEAYQRLKHPLKRAAYLCDLQGAPINAERNTAMPAGFLMQQMLWREAIEDAQTDAQFESIRSELDAQVRQYIDDITHSLDVQAQPQAAANTVRAWMFVDKLLSQLP